MQLKSKAVAGLGLLVLVMLVATLLVVVPTYGQGHRPQFGDDDLKAVAERIINGTISEEQFESFHLSEEEKQLVPNSLGREKN